MNQQRQRQPDRMQPRRGLVGNGLLLALLICFGLGPATAWSAIITVGPNAGVCGSPCDHSTIQAAIDAASPGDTITVYRNTGGSSDCYDEHITVNVANLTIQGVSKTAASAACLGPKTGGDMVTVSASGVTLKDLEISGKAGFSSSFGNGGRASGSGVLITATGTTTIENCTISYTASDNVRYAGGAGGNVVIQNSYLHHSDSKGNVYIYRGGSSSDPHKISDCLIHTGRGLLIEADYVTVEKSIIKGWPYYGALGSGGLANYPEQGPGDSRRGWRYYSNCRVGIWVNSFPSDANHNVLIKNNVVIGARQGIRVGTVGTIKNNTVVNPYSLHSYDPTISAGDSAAVTARLEAIRDNTFGIMISNSFAGSVLNNIVVVEADNRYAGYDGYTTADSAPYYTPGILGYGIGFNPIAVSPTLNGATIRRNSVWGFVDPDQNDSNWGPNLTDCGRNCTSGCSENISSDPNFASDTDDESNGGSSPCDADADDSRCYELYDDNYFLSSKKGSCHGNIRPNTAGYFGFVDLTDNDVDSDDFKGLADCSDANWPTTADTDSKYSFLELGDGGTVLNMGAFGGTDRAGKVPPVGIKAITLGDGSVKDGTEGYSGPGVIQARSSGITNVYVDFTQDVSISSTDVDIRNVCDTADLADPDTFSYDNNGGLGPFRLTMSWNTAFVDRGILIRINDTVTDLSANALDGEFADPITSTIPGGNDTAGGDAVFIVYSVVGDVNGDRQVTSADLTAITALDGSKTSGLPEDMDGDGTVEGTGSEQDYLAAEAYKADYWITTTTDSGAGSLRQALTDVADSEKIRFDFVVFQGCSPATIDVDSSPLPELDNSSVSIDASSAGVILADSDGDLGDNDDGLYITGDSNIIRGLQIQDFDGKNAAGIYITGSSNTIGGVLNTSANNGLGQGCRISANKEGIHITSGGSNTIQGCLIGTDLAGTADDGNNDEGIWMDNSASNTIGGDRDDGYGNVISGNNKQGIRIKNAGSTGNVIKGNYIGVGVDGSTALGNNQEGIKIDKAPSNTVGSTTSGEENIIANNTKEGVEIKDATSDFNTLRANLIYDNGALSIDITSAGANEDVAAPLVTLASITMVSGSGAAAGAAVDVFTNSVGDSDCLAYIGSATADGSGDWSLGSLSLSGGIWVLATQTDTNGNSSEVSGALILPDYAVDTTVDENDGSCGDGDCSLRDALLLVAADEIIGFDPLVFPAASPATIDVDSSPLIISGNNVTIDASDVGVIIEDTDSDLADGDDGLLITGNGNTILGLQIKNFDAGSSSYGIYITGNSNTIGGTASGEGVTITGCGASGIYATGAGADNNTWRGNLIYDNSAIAIDLAGDGANDDLAAPTITSATDASVVGTSSAANGTNIDIFTNTDGDSDCAVLVCSTTVSSGAWSITSLSLTATEYAVAVQTDTSGNSSEVSSAVLIVAALNSITVDTTADTSDGDTLDFDSLDADKGADGKISLREALAAVGDSQSIVFDISVFPPATPATIDVDSSELPTLDNSSVTIDASTAGVILADSDGDLGDNIVGLAITGSSNIIRGLQIQDFTGKNGAGIYISGSSNTIGGVLNTSADNGLGQGCRISANKTGIWIDAGDSNTIQGCLIGTNLAGTGDDGNTGDGILIDGGASNTIGGDHDDGYGNVISGNNKTGMKIKNAGADNNVVKGNYIGVGVDGSTAVGNSQEGIKIEKAASSNTIGSTTSGEENVIANNGNEGVEIKDATSAFNTLRANLIYDNVLLAIDITTVGAQEDVTKVSVDTVSTTQVDGSGADANAIVDIFSNTDGDSDCLVYVGSVTADGSGDFTLGSLTLTTGHYAVAVQTDGNGNTSEVSTAVVVP